MTKLGILSDAHGNLGAFEAALDALGAGGAEQFCFLGDAVGYIPDPAVAGRLESSCRFALMGNHEAMLFMDDITTRQDEVYRLRETKSLMDVQTHAFLRGLPPSRRETLDGARCLFVHGSPADPTYEYVYPDSDLSRFVDDDTDVVFMGHTHRPFVRSHGRTMFVNVGSCGLPRDDDPRGAACLFDPASREARIVRFDISMASRDVLARHDVHDSVAAILRRTACRTVDD